MMTLFLIAMLALIAGMFILLPFDLRAFKHVLDHYIEVEAKRIYPGTDELTLSRARLWAINRWMEKADDVSRTASRLGGSSYLYYIKGYGRNVGTEV